MFSGCSSLASLDLSTFDTSAAKDLSYLFYGCSSLASLNLSSFDTSNVEKMANLFYNCSKLAEVVLGELFAWAASDGAAYLPSTVPGNKADTYRAVVPCGEGDAVEDGSDVSNGAQAGENADAATGAGGESAPNGESSAIAAEGLTAAEREDYMTALAMANPSAAAPSVLA